MLQSIISFDIETDLQNNCASILPHFDYIQISFIFLKIFHQFSKTLIEVEFYSIWSFQLLKLKDWYTLGDLE